MLVGPPLPPNWTVIRFAPATTWLLVRISPRALTTMPEPLSLCVPPPNSPLLGAVARIDNDAWRGALIDHVRERLWVSSSEASALAATPVDAETVRVVVVPEGAIATTAIAAMRPPSAAERSELAARLVIVTRDLGRAL